MKDANEMQIDQMKSQIAEMRSKMDEFLSGPQVSERARQRLEQARQTALGVGQRMSDQKGMAIPVGTIVLSLLALFTLFLFYPDFGTKTTDTLRRWWHDYFGNTEEY